MTLLRAFTIAIALIIAVFTSPATWALGQEPQGDGPLETPQEQIWAGLESVTDHPARVHHTGVNGNERFYFRGDAEVINDVLRKFAALDAPGKEVVLRPGPGNTSTADGEAVAFDWQLHVIRGVARYITTLEGGDRVWNPAPTLTIFLGGSVHLEQLELPEGLQVCELSELKQRIEAALASTDATVRSIAAPALAHLDPYDVESVTKLAPLLSDPSLPVRRNAAAALAAFGPRAKPALSALSDAIHAGDPTLTKLAIQAISGITSAKAEEPKEPQIDPAETHQRQVEQIHAYLQALKSPGEPWQMVAQE